MLDRESEEARPKYDSETLENSLLEPVSYSINILFRSMAGKPGREQQPKHLGVDLLRGAK